VLRAVFKHDGGGGGGSGGVNLGKATATARPPFKLLRRK